MKERLYLLGNVALFLLALFVLATLKTSLWFQMFGYFPGPAFWIPCLIYIALFRSTLESVIFSYLAAFTLSAQTVMPEGILMVVCLALTLSTQLFKRRIYWQASSYVMLVCGLGAFMFNFFHFIATQFIGDLPMARPQFTDWLIEALLTPLVAPVLFPIFHWFDTITHREQPSEASAQVT